MKIVVVGGSGLVGSKLVTMLTHDGHEVVAARTWTGAVLRGPAKDPLKTYRVTVEGELGCVDVPLAHAVPDA